jgi:hypothetical protein
VSGVLRLLAGDGLPSPSGMTVVGTNKNASLSPAAILALIAVDFRRWPTTRRHKSATIITKNGNGFSMPDFRR